MIYSPTLDLFKHIDFKRNLLQWLFPPCKTVLHLVISGFSPEHPLLFHCQISSAALQQIFQLESAHHPQLVQGLGKTMQAFLIDNLTSHQISFLTASFGLKDLTQVQFVDTVSHGGMHHLPQENPLDPYLLANHPSTIILCVWILADFCLLTFLLGENEGAFGLDQGTTSLVQKHHVVMKGDFE